jgi:ribosomal protein L16 Arg81 hydroxylase
MVDVEGPDLDRFAEFAEVTVRSAVLQPGDAVFIPVDWWHHLRALQVSVSITFVNFRLDDTFGNRGFELD